MRSISILAVMLISGSAAAQSMEMPRAREGYYVALGAGGEMASMNDDGERHSLVGMGESLRVGQTITPHLGFGLRVDLSGGTSDDYEGGGGGVSLEAQWRIVGDLAVNVGAGFGFASLA